MLQIVLVGQPALTTLLKRPRPAAARRERGAADGARSAGRRRGLAGYVMHRLSIAGANTRIDVRRRRDRAAVRAVGRRPARREPAVRSRDDARPAVGGGGDRRGADRRRGGRSRSRAAGGPRAGPARLGRCSRPPSFCSSSRAPPRRALDVARRVGRTIQQWEQVPRRAGRSDSSADGAARADPAAGRDASQISNLKSEL